MANTVTVQGAHSATVTLGYDSAANAALAQYIANAITAGIQGGSVLPADSAFSGNHPPGIPIGKTGEWVQNTAALGFVTLPTRDDNFVATSFFDVFANADVGQNFLAGTASGTMISSATNASGNVVMGGGNVDIIIRPTDLGAWLIDLGNGADTVQALGPGNDAISVGSGHDSILLGAGNYVVTTGGAATISASTGNETVSGFGTTVIFGNSSNLVFVANGGATVFGGNGSDTLTGGGGPDVFQGGTGGNNVLTAGVGAATLFGGGSGDQLFANGSGAQILYAGAGNETLTGSSASGANDTFVGSAGTTTVVASPNASNLFEFINGQGPGNMFETGLTDVSQIKVHLVGLTVSNQTPGSDLLVQLSDGTNITFKNISGTLTGGNFV
jgi:Ca2+-binding RTX toxin-like protein